MGTEDQPQQPTRPTRDDISEVRYKALKKATGIAVVYRQKLRNDKRFAFHVTDESKKVIGKVSITKEVLDGVEGVARRLARRIPEGSKYYTLAQQQLRLITGEREEAKTEEIEKMQRMWDAGVDEEDAL